MNKTRVCHFSKKNKYIFKFNDQSKYKLQIINIILSVFVINVFLFEVYSTKNTFLFYRFV